MKLIESVGSEGGMRIHEALLFVAVVSACDKNGTSICSATQVRDILKDQPDLVKLTRNGGGGVGYGSYNILSFSDRLTKAMKELIYLNLIIGYKKKNRWSYSLTENAASLIEKMCTDKTIALYLTSPQTYERAFVQFNNRKVSVRKVLSFQDLMTIKQDCGMHLSEELLTKLSNSIEDNLITKVVDCKE